MERCPCCNARLRERTVCSRCKSDLHTLISAEQKAQYWLFQAIQYCRANEVEQCIAATCASLNLKEIKLAVLLREFLIQQQCREILNLLAEKQLLVAKQRLYSVRMLFPYSKQLKQINAFSEYLLTQHPEYLQPLHSSEEKLLSFDKIRESILSGWTKISVPINEYRESKVQTG